MKQEEHSLELSSLSQRELLHSLHAEIQTPSPYAEDVFLLQTEIAGTSHVVGLEELEPFLLPGERVKLVRVPANPSDPNAIKIYTRDQVKLGYVPRKDNPILARLMDAGKLLYAVIRSKQWQNGWLRMEIGIYMTED